MKWINLTPHALTIDGIGVLPASGAVARVESVRVALGTVGGVAVTRQTLGAVMGLPASSDGVAYIVSALVLEAARATLRAGVDVFAPDTGPGATRKDGQIVSVRGLVC